MNRSTEDGKIRIIYIAGYGHSGSTILETLLSCPDEVIGLGELVGIPRELNASFTIEFMKKNKFCSEIYQRVKEALSVDGESLESIRELNTFENFFSRMTEKQQNRYNQFWSTFLNAAADHPNHLITSFVDSSKTTLGFARRPYNLQNIDGAEVVMVQIVRHPRTILNRLKNKDVLRNKSRRLSANDDPTWINEFIQVFKTVLNWTFSNVWPAISSRKSTRYIRISFEELCEFPVETLKKIEQRCKIDLSDTINRIQNDLPLPSTCGFTGNIPVKKEEKELRFQPSKKSIPKTGPFIYLISLLLVPIYKFLIR